MIGGKNADLLSQRDEIFLQFGSCKMFYRFLMMIAVVDIPLETPLIETFHMCELLCTIVRTCVALPSIDGENPKKYFR